MKRHTWMLLTVVALFACSDDEGDGGSSPVGSGAAGSGASGTASGGSAASAAGGSGQGGSAGDASGGSGSATGGSASGGSASGGSAPGGSGNGGGSACPDEPGDTPCVVCLKGDCCPQLLACAQDPTCVCWRDCMKMPSDAGMCFQMCGDPSPATVEYGQCGSDSCQSQCPQFQ